MALSTRESELLAEQKALIEREDFALEVLTSSRDHAERAIAQSELDRCVERLLELDIELSEIIV